MDIKAKNNKSKRIHDSNFALTKTQLYMQKSIQLIYPKNNQDGSKVSIFRRALRSLELLKIWSKYNNPYATWFLCEIENEIDKIKIEMENIIEATNRLRQKEHSRSQIIIKWIQPHKKPPPLRIRITSPHAYIMIELIVMYDKTESQCLTLKRCGIAGINEIFAHQVAMTQKMKDLFNKIVQCEKLITKYKIEKCTVNKILNPELLKSEAMVAAVKELEEELRGKLPEDILAGKRKPRFHTDSDPTPIIS